MPLARATGMGSTFDWADHSNRVCFLVRSTISWPVIAGLATVVVMDSSRSKSFHHGGTAPRRQSILVSISGDPNTFVGMSLEPQSFWTNRVLIDEPEFLPSHPVCVQGCSNAEASGPVEHFACPSRS